MDFKLDQCIAIMKAINELIDLSGAFGLTKRPLHRRTTYQDDVGISMKRINSFI